MSHARKIKDLLRRRIHIVEWLPRYSKVKFISDLIAGITVGLTMIPQSLAYASLADIPPQYGLYTAFMGSFAYVFFGTIKEASIGPTSLMALLVFSYTADKPMDYVILLCFLCGCVEFLMGVLRLGNKLIALLFYRLRCTCGCFDYHNTLKPRGVKSAYAL